ncbi:MAG: CopG family ribbon-helix-helix protein [Promethearchaeota archaeon]
MAKKKPKRISNFLGFRLSEEILEKLDLIAKQQNKTRGLIAKDAIEQWLNLEIFNQTNQMIMISKNAFSRILSKLDNEYLNIMAKDFVDQFSDIITFLLAKPMNEETLEAHAGFSINFFGKNGLKWFNTIDIQIQNSLFIFRGLHDLDESFSNFFSLFYKYLLSEYFKLNFSTQTEMNTSNLVHLELKLE